MVTVCWVSENRLNRSEFSFPKRLFDIVLSSVGLVLLSPVWAIVWVAMLFDDGLPVFLKQKRIGKGGIPFNSFKIRSMARSALNEHINVQAEENDVRVTRIGRVLRDTALDESPQLINILMGEMSFVGPRPLLQSEIEVHDPDNHDIRKIPGYEQRISVVPGLTGIAQLYLSRDIPRQDKFRYDLEYVRKRNMLLDLKLIGLSFIVTLMRRWEKRNTKLALLRKSETNKSLRH
jgi:lipopolysaccharide/colanic/teichoic acid biosynthesis glycosyltransferase